MYYVLCFIYLLLYVLNQITTDSNISLTITDSNILNRFPNFIAHYYNANMKNTHALNLFISAILLALAGNVRAQDYSVCQNLTLNAENSTNYFNSRIITLTNFLQTSPSDQLISAMTDYLQNGSSTKIDALRISNQNFYLIVIVILMILSLLTFIAIFRMGSLKASTPHEFEESKSNKDSFSTPISGCLLILSVCVILLGVLNSYLIPVLMSDLNKSKCSFESFKSIISSGNDGSDWGGVTQFLNKLDRSVSFLSAVESQLLLNNSIYLNETNIAKQQIFAVRQSYLSLVDQYTLSQMSFTTANAKQSSNISLLTLIPNLFINVSPITQALFSPITTFISELTNASLACLQIEFQLGQGNYLPNYNIRELNLLRNRLQLQINTFTGHYEQFLIMTDGYFKDSKTIATISEVIVVGGIIGGILSILGACLISKRYDDFHLKIYKLIWSLLLICLCLHLVLILLLYQIFIFNSALCLTTYNILSNTTILNATFHINQQHTGAYLVANCLSQSNFITVSATTDAITHPSSLLSNFDSIQNVYSFAFLTNYVKVVDDVRYQIEQYKFGINGSIAIINEYLNKLNNITINNPFHENCYKHHWEFSKQNCLLDQSIYVMPNNISFMVGGQSADGYQSAARSCLLMNNLTQSAINTSKTINVTTFNQIYGKDQACLQSTTNIKNISFDLFAFISEREDFLGSLIQEVDDLEVEIKQVIESLINYQQIRLPFYARINSRLNRSISFAEISNGNNCTSILFGVQTMYSKFCIDFKAELHMILIVAITSEGFIFLLILFGFLYAAELKSLSEKHQHSSLQNERNSPSRHSGTGLFNETIKSLNSQAKLQNQ